MPQISLDLSRPIVVLTGIFNPAIFDPAWSARHLYDVPSGDTVNIVVAEGIGSGGLIAFLSRTGVSVSPTRLEIYSKDGSAESCTEAETIARKIVQTLPHTPLGALGLNFGFIDADPPGAVTGLFATREKLEEQFALGDRMQKVKINEEDGSSRTVERLLTDETFSVSFNHHFPDLNPQNADALLEGKLAAELQFAKDFCGTYFGYDDFGVTTLPFPEV